MNNEQQKKWNNQRTKASLLLLLLLLGHMWIMLGTYANLELTNLLTKRILLVIE